MCILILSARVSEAHTNSHVARVFACLKSSSDDGIEEKSGMHVLTHKGEKNRSGRFADLQDAKVYPERERKKELKVEMKIVKIATKNLRERH